MYPGHAASLHSASGKTNVSFASSFESPLRDRVVPLGNSVTGIYGQ